MRTIWIGAALFCALTASSFVGAQEAATVIRLYYTSTYSSGTANLTITARFVGGKQIEEMFEGTSEKLRGGYPMQSSLGGRWRVISDNRLRRTVEHPNHFQIWDVTIRGRSCHLTMQTQLKPGKTEYLLQGIDRRYSKSSKPRYTNVYCTIS